MGLRSGDDSMATRDERITKALEWAADIMDKGEKVFGHGQEHVPHEIVDLASAVVWTLKHEKELSDEVILTSYIAVAYVAGMLEVSK
jgi:hypothetical protein